MTTNTELDTRCAGSLKHFQELEVTAVTQSEYRLSHSLAESVKPTQKSAALLSDRPIVRLSDPPRRFSASHHSDWIVTVRA